MRLPRAVAPWGRASNELRPHDLLAKSAGRSYHGGMVRSAPEEIDRLRREVERALSENFDSEDVLPLLARLARAAHPDSDAWLFAHRHLAELGVEHDPWR